MAADEVLPLKTTVQPRALIRNSGCCADFTVADMAANISVVAAGNAVGAVLLVGMVQKFSLFGNAPPK